MGFIEIKKSSPSRGNPNVHATFSMKKDGSKENVGFLRILRKGMEFIEENGIKIKADDAAKVFYDPDTGRVAFKKDENASFRFTKNSKNTLRMSYKDLGKIIKEIAEYKIELSDDFDLLLVPVHREAIQNTEK